MAARVPLHCIVPPQLLFEVARQATYGSKARDCALRTLAIDQTFRQARAAGAARQLAAAQPTVGGMPGEPHRTIYDQQHSETMALGRLVWNEGAPPVEDPAVNEVVTGFGATYDLFWSVFHRDSINDQGMPMVGLVHFGSDYDNAFWDGEGHMFFGDGDGQMFTRLTKSIDVIGHELTHGVTQYTANLAYQDQAGALNESVSDVFGSLVKQHHNHQSAADADWLIGDDVVGPALKPALRSLKAPGTANPHDDQPGDMDHFVRTAADHGGVHTNSGIPSHAFYVAATTIGGNAWEQAGRIWYESLRDGRMRPDTNFAGFARITVGQAQQLFGATSKEADAVKAGWEKVKVQLVGG
jgi:Zn-dependent metalloprotease